MPSDQSQGDSGGSSVSISGSSRRRLSALCGSAVNGGAKRLTAETQRTLSWRREFESRHYLFPVRVPTSVGHLSDLTARLKSGTLTPPSLEICSLPPEPLSFPFVQTRLKTPIK